MIGTVSDADLALNGQLEFIGEGSTRDVYLSNGIVYKVGCEDEQTNVSEYRNAEWLRPRVSSPFVVPPVYLHRNGVLAMPYINGILSGECSSNLFDLPCEDLGECMPEDIRDIGYLIGPDIVTWGNTIRVGALYYLIDLGTISLPLTYRPN